MINEENVAQSNLVIQTPSPLSSAADRSSNEEEENSTVNGSSSSGSSPSDLKKRLQDLPSRNEVTRLANRVVAVSRRLSRKRDAYFHLQGTTSRIEEKDEREEDDDEEQEEEVKLRKTKSSREFKAKDPRARRRERIRLQTLKIGNEMMVFSNATGDSILKKEPEEQEKSFRSSHDENRSFEQDLDDVYQSTVETEKNYCQQSSSFLRRMPHVSNPYFAQDFSHEVNLPELQRDSHTSHVHSQLSTENSPKDRIELQPLSPISLSNTRPMKFGGYRPPPGIVLRNLSSGSESESNHEVPSNLTVSARKVDNPIALTSSPVNFLGANSRSSILSARDDSRNSQDHFLCTPLSSSQRSATSHENTDRSNADILTRETFRNIDVSPVFKTESKDVIIEEPNSPYSSVARSSNDRLPSANSRRQVLCTNPLYRSSNFSVFNESNPNHSPILSSRSDICDYNPQLSHSPLRTSRTAVSRESYANHLRNVFKTTDFLARENACSAANSRNDSYDKLVNDTTELCEGASNKESNVKMDNTLLRSSTFSINSSHLKSYSNETSNTLNEQRYYSHVKENFSPSHELSEAETSKNINLGVPVRILEVPEFDVEKNVDCQRVDRNNSNYLINYDNGVVKSYRSSLSSEISMKGRDFDIITDRNDSSRKNTEFIQKGEYCDESMKEIRDFSKESFQYCQESCTKGNSQNSDNISESKKYVPVPALVLNSQEISESTSPDSKRYVRQQVLDANALITALSNVSLNEQTRRISTPSRHEYNEFYNDKLVRSNPLSCKNDFATSEKIHTPKLPESGKESAETLRTCRNSSFKARSKIPVKIPLTKTGSSPNTNKSTELLSKKSVDNLECLTSRTLFVNPNSQISPDTFSLSKESYLDSAKTNHSSQFEKSEETLSLDKNHRVKREPESVGSMYGLSSSLNLEELNGARCCEIANRKVAENKLENMCFSPKDVYPRNNVNSMEKERTIKERPSQVAEIDLNFENTPRETFTQNNQQKSKEFVTPINQEVAVTRESKDFSNTSNDGQTAYSCVLDTLNYEYHDEINNIRLESKRKNFISSIDITENASDFDNCKSPRDDNNEILESNRSDMRKMSSVKESTPESINCDVTPRKSGINVTTEIIVHSRQSKEDKIEEGDKSLKGNYGKETQDKIIGQNLQFRDEIGDTKHTDESIDERTKLNIKDLLHRTNQNTPEAEGVTNNDAHTENRKKLQFSIERLAAEQFRRNIFAEHAEAVQSENVAILSERIPEVSPFPIRFSSSTSKLHRTPDRIKDFSPRLKKRSQDRFPFTISEKTSAVSTKYKIISGRAARGNLERNSTSSENVYKLHIHPSITRLAGAGIEDTPTEIKKYLAYSEQEENQGRSPGMKGIVQRFSARIRRSRKKQKKAKKTNEATNVIYENCAYQEDSMPNSYSESSLVEEDKDRKRLSKSVPFLDSSPEEKSSLIREGNMLENKTRNETSPNIEHPYRRYDRDDMWVQALKNVDPNHQKSTNCAKIEKLESPKSLSKDPYSLFLVKDACNLVENVKKLSPANSKHDKSNLMKRRTNRVRVSGSLPTILTDFKEDVYIEENLSQNTIDDETEKDAEADCFCLRFCQTIARISIRFLSAYPPPINTKDPHSTIKREPRFSLRKRKG